VSKKKVFVLVAVVFPLILVALVVVYFIGLGQRNFRIDENGEYVRYLESTYSGVVMYVDEESLTRERVGIRLVNYTDYDYEYGLRFSLLVADGNRWRYVRNISNFDIPDISLHIPANSYAERYIFLAQNFGRLNRGEYRIVQRVNRDGYRPRYHGVDIVGGFVLR